VEDTMKTDISEAAFIDRAFELLPPLQDPADRGIVTEAIRQQFREMWSLEDVVEFHSVMQEFDPYKDELIALNVMRRIASKYAR
jgi:hypothetical protein